MINTKGKLQKLKGILENNPNGITIDLKTLKPKKFKMGYYIGLSDNSDKDVGVLVKAINTQLNNLKSVGGVYCGYWKDKNTNISYLDLSVYIGNLDVALIVAKEFSQKAIYGIKEENSIYLN